MNIIKTIKYHPLVDTLIHLKGNPRACIFTEPLWGIPFNLYAPFITLYMFALGVHDKQIGILLSVGMVLQVITSILGGVVIDKVGRRLTTMVFDIVSWSIPCLIWAFSQNFWWFFVAAIFNSLWQVTSNSWICLLIEDAETDKISNMFMWVYISGLVAVFFTPISGLLIKNFSLVPTMRMLYLFSFISMTAKFILLYKYGSETKQGKKRINETKGVSYFTLLAGYGSIFKKILANKATCKVLLIMALFYVTGSATGTFFQLYASQNLSVPDQFFAYFPIIRAIVMLVLMFGVQHILDRFPMKHSMAVGILVYIISQVVLIFSPVHNIPILVFYVFLDACAYGIVMPRKDTLVAMNIEPQERSRISSVLNVCMIALASPFGYINGYLSSIDRRLPFVLNIILFVLAFVVIINFSNIEQSTKQNQTNL